MDTKRAPHIRYTNRLHESLIVDTVQEQGVREKKRLHPSFLAKEANEKKAYSLQRPRQKGDLLNSIRALPSNLPMSSQRLDTSRLAKSEKSTLLYPRNTQLQQSTPRIRYAQTYNSDDIMFGAATTAGLRRGAGMHISPRLFAHVSKGNKLHLITKTRFFPVFFST